MLKGGAISPSVGRHWGFGKIQREGTDARCYNLRVRVGNEAFLNEQLSWRGSNGLERGRRWGLGLRSQLQELGRLTAICLFQVLNSVQPLWGLVWVVTQASPVEVRLLSWAELGVQLAQKLELWNPISRLAF